MEIIQSIDALRSWRTAQSANQSVGFVPTMGALHQGHLALVQQSIADNDTTVVSIYVNPTQFNQAADLAAYPVDIEGDIELLRSVNCPAVFLPDHHAMYPDGVHTDSFDLMGLDTRLEGKLRPGHFQGVATVVNRLFDLVTPTRAYFGWKDFQQVKVIQRLAELRNHTEEIVPMPIIRAQDGLALSSRNRRLSPKQRRAAPVIYDILDHIKQSQGVESPRHWRNVAGNMISQTGELDLEDLEFVNANTLELLPEDLPLRNYNEPIRLLISVFAQDVRLIDNDVVEWP